MSTVHCLGSEVQRRYHGDNAVGGVLRLQHSRASVAYDGRKSLDAQGVPEVSHELVVVAVTGSDPRDAQRLQRHGLPHDPPQQRAVQRRHGARAQLAGVHAAVLLLRTAVRRAPTPCQDRHSAVQVVGVELSSLPEPRLVPRRGHSLIANTQRCA